MVFIKLNLTDALWFWICCCFSGKVLFMWFCSKCWKKVNDFLAYWLCFLILYWQVHKPECQGGFNGHPFLRKIWLNQLWRITCLQLHQWVWLHIHQPQTISSSVVTSSQEVYLFCYLHEANLFSSKMFLCYVSGWRCCSESLSIFILLLLIVKLSFNIILTDVHPGDIGDDASSGDLYITFSLDCAYI